MSTLGIQERVDNELDSSEFVQFDRVSFRQKVAQLVGPTTAELDRRLRWHAAFHLVFLSISIVEFGCFIAFFTLLARSSTLAFSLALLFLTLFSYFMLRLYFRTRKADELINIRDQFIEQAKQLLGYQEGINEHQMALANACFRMATALHSRERTYYRPPSWAEFLTPSLERLSCYFHWHDLHAMRETFLLAAVDEHIKLVKCKPTNLEVHAALANAYVMLSSLYRAGYTQERDDEDGWSPPERARDTLEHNFRITAERAIEEFKILNHYAPRDPWVHAQLAYSYHDLGMPEEEIKQYEMILHLDPDDKETLFKLGMLYFQQGRNADGLGIYEKLKAANYRKAEDLIKFYGSC